jgi:hypothetical protein
MSVNRTPSPATRDAAGLGWTHWVNLIDGILLFIAPWVLGYSGTNTTAYVDGLVLGTLIAIFAFIGLVAHTTGGWTQWIVLILGILSFISPWVLGYANVMSAFWANIILGAIAVIFAAIGIFARPKVSAM